jgi:hypothetical protein
VHSIVRHASEFDAGADARAADRDQDIGHRGKAGIFILAAHKKVWRERNVEAAADVEAVQQLPAFPGAPIEGERTARTAAAGWALEDRDICRDGNVGTPQGRVTL